MKIIITDKFRDQLIKTTPVVAYQAYSLINVTDEKEFEDSSRTDLIPFNGIITNNHILVIRVLNSLSISRYKSVAIYNLEKEIILIITDLQLFNGVENIINVDLSNLDKPKGIIANSESITHKHLTADLMTYNENELSEQETVDAMSPPSAKYIVDLFCSRTNSPNLNSKADIQTNFTGQFLKMDSNNTLQELFCEMQEFKPLYCNNISTRLSAIVVIGEIPKLSDGISYDGVLHYDDRFEKITYDNFSIDEE